MENPMRERIQARLNALGISAIEAAKRVPTLNRYFIYDFMNGKKASIPAKRIEEVAQALECDKDYLLGTARGTIPGLKSLTLSGIIEPGTWRAKQPDFGTPLHVLPDNRFPAESQLGFICRCDDFGELGIPNGAVVVTTLAMQPRVGDIVVTKESRDGPTGREHMISAARIASNHKLLDMSRGDSKILGVVVQAISVF